jgi:RNA polymerase sigma-70 factor (ECF subfamily)
MSDDLRSKVDPEDVAQEVLLAVHQGFQGFDRTRPAGFMGWLFTIAENRIRDLAKHFAARKRHPLEAMQRSQTSPSARLARAESLDRMRTALERLPAAYREIIRLRSIQERSYAEIAEQTDRTEGACRVLYCRALAALRDALEARAT